MAEPTSATVEAEPAAGQNILHGGQEYTTIKEGLAHILVPKGTPTSTDPKMSKEDAQKQQVFYNPIQQFNRDLSVLAIKTFGDDLVQRRLEKHEKQVKKAQRQGEKRKRKSETNTNGDEPSETKRRRVTDNDGSHCPSGDGSHSEPTHGSMDKDSEPNVSKEQREWKPSFTILDALSATGLRALRYAKEIPNSTSVTANDLSPKATEAIMLNVKHNKLEAKIKANTGNAMAHMYSFLDKSGYDVIDLDPYGTAAPFLDSAIHAINDGGLLCVTCTDSAIFASHGYLEKTYSQYGGLPLIGVACHEGGLRLLLHAIASSAARYGMAIEPLLSLSIDYYIRVFVRVRKQPSDVKLLAGKTMTVYHCQNGCRSFTTQFLARNKSKTNRDGTASYQHSFAQAPSTNSLCEHCGTKTHLSGPMYGGPLHNIGFIQRILAQLNEIDVETYPTKDRIEGMLRTALEEITYGAGSKETTTQLDALIPKADPGELEHHPFFIVPSALAKVLHCSAPPLAAMRGALRHAGFEVTMSHCKPGSIRTTAPWAAIWHIMIEWIRQKAPLKKPLNQNTAGYAIIAKAMPPLEYENEAAVGEAEADSGQAPEAAPKAEHANGEDSKTTGDSNDAGVSRPSYLGYNFEVKFDEQLGKDHDRGKIVRYQLAPRENWGPMSRAK